MAETAGWMPSSLKCSWLRGVVDAGDDAVAEVLLLGHLADEHVVLVVAGDRDHEVGTLDAGALEHPQLGGVAVLGGVLELLLDREVAGAGGLDQRHLLVLGDQLTGEVAPDLPCADDDRVHDLWAGVLTVVSGGVLNRERTLEHLDRVLRRGDRVQSPVRHTSRPARGPSRGR